MKNIEFNIVEAKNILNNTPEVLNSLLHGLEEAWIRNIEGPNTWSPYDIVGHLIHGEKTDWIPRAKIILYESDKNFIPFDREAQRNNDQSISIKALLEEFRELRHKNLKDLDAFNLTEKDLELIGIHPEFGEVNLKQLISTWAGHDLGHIYQMSRVLAKNYKEECGPWVKYLRVMKD